MFGRERPGWFSGSNTISVETLHQSLVYNITMAEHNNLDSYQPHHVKMATVYASSSAALRPVYYDAARRIGEVLASAGKSIIYGAGGGGLMGSIADGALSRNGKVYGVVPGFLQEDDVLQFANVTPANA